MRRLPDGSLRYSPKDLLAYLEGDFAAWCERNDLEARGGGGRGKLAGRAITPDSPDEELALAAKRGIAHEAAHLERLRTEEPGLVEVPRGDDAHSQTVRAMQEGAPIIFQGELLAEPWMGIADFLHRVEGESTLGAHYYEPWDTKLARSAKPYFLVQLCAYLEMLEAMQGRRPERFGFVLGDGTLATFRSADVWHYYRRLKRSFDVFQRDWKADQLPDASLDRTHGRWSASAAAMLAHIDDLSLVAGISRSQIVRLRAAGIDTVAELATCEEIVPRMTAASLATLREQAAMQVKSRTTGEIAWTLRPTDAENPRRGLALLPPASPLDIFFDIEGFPYAPSGLEYLLGVTTKDAGVLAFRDWWAHDDAAERIAFEQFIDWVWDRMARDPGMHIYHYAAYEKSALSKLSTKHATREWEVDQILRYDILVDLYTVVRQGMVIGTPSYSLKEIEHLYMPARTEEVTSAGGSVVEYQKWIDSGEPGDWRESPRLNALRDYNRVDCDSTLYLRDWLLARQAEAGVHWLRRGELPTEPVTDRPQTEIERYAASLLERADTLEAGSEAQRVTRLLAWLLEFHRRDAKPMWWRFFERLKQGDEELFDDVDCLAGLVRTDREPWPEARSLVYEYAFDPDQDTRLHEGSSCYVLPTESTKLKIHSIDPAQGRLTLKIGATRELPVCCTLIPDEFQSPGEIPGAIERYVRSWADGESLSPAIDDLIARRVPRLTGRSGPIIGAGNLVDETIAAVRAMDRTTLAIQGPPGTGKTTTAALVIIALLQDGKKIGVVANSHAVIMNLFAKIVQEAPELAGKSLYKVGGPDEEPMILAGAVQRVASNAGAETAAAGPLVIGGTAWLFSRADMADTLDYLFVDEAGQFSLANTVAVGLSANNLILMGDQMQLAQPTQGVHPGESGASALTYLLQQHAVIPDTLGIFLRQSYRMHPAVCAVISEAYYDDRLTSVENTSGNRIVGGEASSFGLDHGVRFVAVSHEGNTQSSPEEVDRVAALVGELLACRVTLHGGAERAMTLDDILIVAPFNMQVRALKARLGEEARVGSVDKFQGQEAPVVIVSMCASTLDDAPRGPQFLLSPNRLNVAISRAQALAIVVGSPELGNLRVRSVEEMRLVSGWCRIEAL